MIARPDQIGAGVRVSPRFAESAWVQCFDRLGLNYEFGGGPTSLSALSRHLWFGDTRQVAVFEPNWDAAYFRTLSLLDGVMPLPPVVEQPGALDLWLIALDCRGGFCGHGRFGRPGGPIIGGLVTDLMLVHCECCGAWWWCSESESWGCRSCGHHDGRKHFEQILRSPLPGWPAVTLDVC